MQQLDAILGRGVQAAKLCDLHLSMMLEQDDDSTLLLSQVISRVPHFAPQLTDLHICSIHAPLLPAFVHLGTLQLRATAFSAPALASLRSLACSRHLTLAAARVFMDPGHEHVAIGRLDLECLEGLRRLRLEDVTPEALVLPEQCRFTLLCGQEELVQEVWTSARVDILGVGMSPFEDLEIPSVMAGRGVSNLHLAYEGLLQGQQWRPLALAGLGPLKLAQPHRVSSRGCPHRISQVLACPRCQHNNKRSPAAGI